MLEDVRDSPGWLVMKETMLKEKGTATWQQVLAVHTSNCCQLQRIGGVVADLEAAGLRYPLTASGSGKIAVDLTLR